MTKTFRIAIWYGKAARGGGSRQDAPASYGESIETVKFRAQDLNLVRKNLVEQYSAMFPKNGRLKLHCIKVEEY